MSGNTETELATKPESVEDAKNGPKIKSEPKTEFKVPPEKQYILRQLDQTAAGIQRALGAAEIEYHRRREDMIRSFEENRKANDSTLLDIARAEGLDLSKPDEVGTWIMDFATMTFKRTIPPSKPQG